MDAEMLASLGITAAIYAGCALVAVLVLIYAYVGYVSYRTGGMPGPSFWWIMSHFDNFHVYGTQLLAKYGGLYKIFVGNNQFVVVSDPDLLRETMTNATAFPKIEVTDMFQSAQINKFLGRPVIGQNGAVFNNTRKCFGPVMHNATIQALVPAFHHCVQRWLRFSEPDPRTNGGKPVEAFEMDCKSWTTAFTMDVLGHTMFGADMGCMPPKPRGTSGECAHTLLGAYDCIMGVMGDATVLWLAGYDNWPTTKHHKCLPRSIKLMNDFLLSMVERAGKVNAAARAKERRLAAAGAGADDGAAATAAAPPVAPPPLGGSTKTPTSVTEKPDSEPDVAAGTTSADGTTVVGEVPFDFEEANIITKMAAAMIAPDTPEGQPSLTREEIRANCFNFFVAGHETTANSLAWALFHLATNQDAQQRVADEIATKLEPGCPTYEALKPANLPILDAFIQENLRREPPVAHLNTRMCAVDTKVGKYTVPKGAILSGGIYNVHNSPAVWANPRQFDIDRFLTKATKRHPCAHMPFNYGRRKCMGANFSLLEMRVFLTGLLRVWRVMPPSAHKGATDNSDKAFYDTREANFHMNSPSRMSVRFERR